MQLIPSYTTQESHYPDRNRKSELSQAIGMTEKKITVKYSTIIYIEKHQENCFSPANYTDLQFRHVPSLNLALQHFRIKAIVICQMGSK